MHLGIFAKTFPRSTFEETLDAIADRGLTHVQFNMSCTGLPTLPDRVDENHCVWIARSFRERGLTMAAISGTFNLCDPDASRLADNLHRLEALAAACRWLDTRIITLCTGTRDPEDMWKWHPENVRKSTWDTLVASMREAVNVADRHEVNLAFEPELNNVVNSVARARMLLDQVDSPWLKVVIDPANLMRAGDFPRMEEVLDEAFDWLGRDIVLAHAKHPTTGRGADEMITIQEYLNMSKGRMPYLPMVWGKLLDPAKAPQDIEELLHFREAPQDIEELLHFREEALASEVPRQAVDRQEFYFNYVKRLSAMNFTGALVMHGMSEEEVDPTHSLIADLLKHSGMAG